MAVLGHEAVVVGERTGIAWTDHTWSPWIGCTEVSPGCDNCYARELDKRYRFGGGVHWGAGVPRYRTKDWKKPLSWNRAAEKSGVRRTVFPSLCDPFDNEVPKEWRRDLWYLIDDTKNLTWLLLTKRIGNAASMIPRGPWPNVWLGASVVNQAEADRDIPRLLATPAAKRFVSLEPLLGPIDLLAVPAGSIPGYAGLRLADLLHWAIVGGESSQGGVKARPFDVAWARSTIAQCKAAGVPVFVKQCGSTPIYGTGRNPDTISKYDGCDYGEGALRFRDRAGADPAEWPADLRVQEFP